MAFNWARRAIGPNVCTESVSPSDASGAVVTFRKDSLHSMQRKASRSFAVPQDSQRR